MLAESIFEATLLGHWNMEGEYYGSFLYEYLSSDAAHFEAYGNSIMEIRKKTFLNWANRLPEMVKDKDIWQYLVWIVSGPFCKVLYAIDRRYFSGDRA